MTTNRLATAAGAAAKLQANDLAAIARELGKFDLAKAWDRRAEELGLERIPNGITVRFRPDGSTERVSLRR